MYSTYQRVYGNSKSDSLSSSPQEEDESATLALYGVAALLSILAVPRTATSQDSNASAKLQVNTSYTGAGKVDEKHKVYVVLWDTADFVKGESSAVPVVIESMASKSGTVTFDGVKKTPAYVSAVYDAGGTWDAQSAPPDGSSLGLYSKSPGGPEPVNLQSGKTTKIDLVFDDTVKMQSGKPTR